MQVLYDKSRDPVRNMGREDELFRRVESRELPELVRFWVDSECLVKGKARSAKYGWYHERLAEGMEIRVVERTTGGGVVYHDEGNLNWSFFLKNTDGVISPRRMFECASSYMIKALGRVGVDARFAPPNRIDVQGRKVSGMAARSTPRTILVHGTLLLRTDLEKLNRLCIPPAGCPPVSNITQWARDVDATNVIRAVVSVLRDSGFKVRMVDSLE
jgi:lipoate-protein ligase A